METKSRFFRVILPQMIQNGTLEIPLNFVKEHGKHLPIHARLKVPTGSETKVELKRCKGRAWLDKGWPDFVHKYSIKCGYFLVFNYEGGSNFRVLIFDLSTSEIEYPTSSARISTTHAVKVEDWHDDDDEMLDEYQLEVKKATYVSVIEGRKLGITSARGRVLERAKAFESQNPHFIVIMQPTYLSGLHCLYIPAGPGRRYFHKKANNNINLEGSNGRVWSVKYSIRAHPRNRVKFLKGWKKFARDNHLEEGDVCVFELVSSREMAFKVAIFRVTDEQFVKDEAIGIPVREETRKGNAKKGVLVAASKREACHVASNTTERVRKRSPGSFMIYMSQYYISCSSKLTIPIAHFRRYLRDNKDGESIIILHGSKGKTWPVNYQVSSKSSKGARFTRGWKNFAFDNHLRVGDICIFDMIFGKAKAYKVTISRVADRA